MTSPCDLHLSIMIGLSNFRLTMWPTIAGLNSLRPPELPTSGFAYRRLSNSDSADKRTLRIKIRLLEDSLHVSAYGANANVGAFSNAVNFVAHLM